MTQKGEHTWDIIIHYHACPACGRIVESREDYVLKDKEKIKELNCPRCKKTFTVVKGEKIKDAK